MFYLCTVESKDIATVFGGPNMDPSQPLSPPKYKDLQTNMIGQKPDCSGYLLLANKLVKEFEKQTSVPERI